MRRILLIAFITTTSYILTRVPRPGIGYPAIEQMPAQHGRGVQALAPVRPVTEPSARRDAVHGHRAVTGPARIAFGGGRVRKSENAEQVPHDVCTALAGAAGVRTRQSPGVRDARLSLRKDGAASGGSCAPLKGHSVGRSGRTHADDEAMSRRIAVPVIVWLSHGKPSTAAAAECRTTTSVQTII